jgi:hypothetical protein
LDEAVKAVLVFLGIETLHLSLDDIDGSVGKDGSSTSNSTREESDGSVSVGNTERFREDGSGFFIDEESDTLVRSLSEDSGGETSVDTVEALSGVDLLDTIEKTFILGLGLEDIVDKLGLQGFLGGNDEDSFSDTSTDTSQEVGELVGFEVSEDIIL